MRADRSRLPTFLVLGTAKAGTTTLHDVLAQHPDIYLPAQGEVNFFADDDRYARGVAWYLETYYRQAGNRAVRGDITPACLYFGEKVVPRLVETFGDAPPRMIAILRDPVARAYSRYWHARRTPDAEPLSFEAAIAAEPERLAMDVEQWQRRGRFRQAYFAGGLYGEQLARYFARFPRGGFHIILFDDLTEHFEATVARLLAFLDVDPAVALHGSHRNRASVGRGAAVERWIRHRSALGRVVRRVAPGLVRPVRRLLRRTFRAHANYPPMDPVFEEQLRHRYLEDVRRLEHLIDRDLSRWYPKHGAPSR